MMTPLEKIAVGGAVLLALAELAVFVGLVYVVIHFVAKLW